MSRVAGQAIRIVGAIAVLIGFVFLAGYFRDSAAPPPATDLFGRPINAFPEGLVSTAKAVGLLLLGGWLLGQLASTVGLSRITGYLVFGIIASPKVGEFLMGGSGRWILAAEQQPYLTLVNNLAIALIALTAGCKIDLRDIREAFRSISLILVFEFTLVLIAVTALLSVMLARNPIFAEYGGLLTVILVAAVVGVVATANSPAVVIAVLSETNAKGVMSSTSLSVTVCKDLLLIIVFALLLGLASNAASTAQAEAVSASQPPPAVAAAVEGEPAASTPDDLPPSDQRGSILTKLTKQIGGSLLGGVGIGVALAMYLRRTDAYLAIILTLGSFAIALICAELGLKPLLVGLAAGLTIANRYKDYKPDLFRAIEQMSVPVYVLFFAVAGAKIDPRLVGEVWGYVAALVTLRALSIWVGTGVGCALSGVDAPASKWIWTAFVPQAGISLALAVVVAEEFQVFAFSDKIYAILLSSIAINELVGPVLFKIGLERAGETRSE
ncbi:MAG: cation:proton antiporter [Phycisphaerales bacterium]